MGNTNRWLVGGFVGVAFIAGCSTMEGSPLPPPEPPAPPAVTEAVSVAAEPVKKPAIVPTTISPEAQAILSRGIDLEAGRVGPKTPEELKRAQAGYDKLRSQKAQQRIDALGLNVETSTIAGVTVRTLTASELPTEKANKVLLHFHGGGYSLGGGVGGTLGALKLASKSGYKIVSVDYRMPPEHPFPAAVEDGVAVYQALLTDYAPEDIAIFGTSAGGGLTAATVLSARDQGLPMPTAVSLNTPWSDLRKIDDTVFINEGLDPVLVSMDRFAFLAEVYAGDAGLEHPLVSPIHGDYTKGFPPSLLISGTRDLLLSNTVRLHRKLRDEGLETELLVFEGMWHAFRDVPEEDQLVLDMTQFFDEHLMDAPSE